MLQHDVEDAQVPASRRLRSLLRPGWLELLGVFLGCLLLLGLIQFTIPGLSDNDGYYHIKMGWLMRQQGLAPEYTWTPLTIAHGDTFYDNHMLFHGYLALFAGGDPDANNGRALINGAKIAIVVLTALAMTAIWLVLRNQRVRYVWLWTFGLFALSDMFLFRMSMVRAQTPSLLMMALGLNALLRQRYRWLVPIGCIYVWLYDAFPLFLFVVAAYVAAVALLERRIAWAAIGFSLAGIAAGLVINPYFPRNILFIITHIGPKIGNTTLDVGQEWYPFDTWSLLVNAGGAVAAFLGTVFVLIWLKRGFDLATLTNFLLSLIFGLLMFKSKRFVEYFPPFVLIFCATSLSPIISQADGGHARLLRRARQGLVSALAIGLIVTVYNARILMKALEVIKPAALYQDAAAWLKQHTPEGSMIYNTFWGDFTYLFFHNTANRYVLGLEPTYMESADPDLYQLYVRINSGEVSQPSQAIRACFKSDYVLADIHDQREGLRDAFLQQASADPGLVEVYRDSFAVIYRVAPAEPGSAPPACGAG